MEILPSKNSKEKIAKLFGIFGLNQKNTDNFVDSKPFLGFIGINIPLLWYPQRKDRKYLCDVFASYIVLSHQNEYDPDENAFHKVICPAITSFLKEKQAKKINLVAEWPPREKELYHHVVEIAPDEIEEVTQKYWGEGYYFPDDLSWLFGTTHENFSYLAGDSQLINDFKKFFPNYPRYDLGHDPFGKEPDHSSCPGF